MSEEEVSMVKDFAPEDEGQKAPFVFQCELKTTGKNLCNAA
jgi:hypothetical protein